MAERWRSRSPAGAAAERISRSLASFGRYPHKRPAGLHVDETGAFSVEELMKVWGWRQGLTQEEVLAAARAHMLHEGGGALRFAILSDEKGVVQIRVLPKRSHGQRPCATPARSQRQTQEPASAAAATKDPPWKADDAPAPSAPAAGAGAWDKGAWSWDAAADTKGGGGWDRDAWGQDSWRSGDTGRGASWWESSADKTGWTAASQWQKRRRGNRWGSGGSGPPRGEPEKVQRWLSWLFKRGHEELGVELDAGWARLDAVAEAMKRSRPDLGALDAQGLRALLEEADTEGRFEVDARGRLRKVPQGSRQPRCSAGSAATSWGRAEVAALSAKSDGAATSEGAATAPATGGGPPPGPPGQHWKKYQDDGVLWWHYDGPLGQWWCSGDLEEPMPYVPEAPA